MKAKRHHLNWVWLLIGGSLFPFILAQTPIALAAWIAPIFLLRFSRTTKSRHALPAIGLATFLGSLVAFRGGFVPGDPSNLYVTAVGIAIAYAVLFGLDKLLVKRVPFALSTFILPLASVAIGFLATLGNPMGTGGSEAYSQTLPVLLQHVSVIGIWGIVFLLYWVAAVVNMIWEQGMSRRSVRLTLASLAGVMLLVGGFGAVTLTTKSTNTPTVQMAGIAPNKSFNEKSTVTNIHTPEGRADSRTRIQPLVDDLFARSAQEIQAGAKIVVWSEASAKVLKEDEGQFIERATKLADQTNTYVQVGLGIFASEGSQLVTENRAIMFTPDGTIAWDYHKANITPGDLDKPGPGIVPSIKTPYGTIATIICQDDLFPAYVAAAGRQDADILLVPSSDWPAVAEWHSTVSPLRAIENGASILRPTRKGVSLAVDSTGTQIARVDGYDDNKEQTVRAHLPVTGKHTLYPRIGDAFAYISVASLLGLGIYAFIRPAASKHKSRS